MATCLLLLVWLKLWSISGDELVIRDYPADDAWYLMSAQGWYWGQSYEDGALMRQPGYPLWIAAARTTGIPLRLATEILFLAAAAAFVASLLVAGTPMLLGPVVFALIAFHPFSFHVNSFALPDSFYAAVLLFALAAMVLTLATRHPAFPILSGLALATLWHTRQESVVIVAYLLLMGGCLAWVRRPQATSVRAASREAIPAVLVAGVIVAASSVVIRAVNLHTFGTFSEYEFATPAFGKAYGALLRIRPNPPRPSIAVPREVRERAYSASRTFRLLRPYFEGPAGRSWESFTGESDDPASRGEIASALFPWAFISAVKRTGHGGNADRAESFYLAMAREIDTACEEERLECRSAPFGPLDPHLENYLGEIPTAFGRVGSQLFWTGPPPARAWPHSVRAEYLAFAEAVTNRRTSLASGLVSLQGWAANLGDEVRAVSLRDPRGQVLASTRTLRPRADLERYFRSAASLSPDSIRAVFDVVARTATPADSSTELVFLLRSGKTVVVPVAEVQRLPLRQIRTIPTGPRATLQFAIEGRRGSIAAARSPGGFQRIVHARYGRAALALTLLAVAAWPLRFLRRGIEGIRLLDGVSLLLLGVTGIRLAVLTIVDASSWPATDPRYVYPVAYLLPCAALLVTTTSLRGLASGGIRHASPNVGVLRRSLGWRR